MTITMMMIAALVQAAPMPQARNDTPDASPPGQRQTRDDAAPNVIPMNRLSTRIENRLFSRVQNRIARSQPDATTINKTATDQSRRVR